MQKLFIIFAVSVFLTTCGLEEYYFLPQVPEANIRTVFNTSATINLPSLNDPKYSYAQYYKIYYKIYISDFNTSSNETSLYSSISTTLASDYNIIYPNTDPNSTTTGTPANNLFTSRNYYELELFQKDINSILSKNGGDIRISFPTIQGGYPVMTLNDGPEYRLLRSAYFFSVNPSDERRYFRNTVDLNVPNYADVISRTGLTQSYAYTSMYIVAVGTNQNNFTPIFSKPTHISVFKLPDNL
jgi:hypothetical protein